MLRGRVRVSSSPTLHERVISLGLVVVVGLMACLLSVVFLCPRFVLWRGLYIHESPFINNPEVLRATDVLAQLDDPFVKIPNITNSVIQWRLLFPLIGHYLRFPVWLYLAIPHIGCVVVLAYVAHLVLREGGTWFTAFFAAALVGTGSWWFFASTGWLTYADSWLLLGLLAASFSPSRNSVAAACLLEPFIDDRFVLALPLAYVTRLIYFQRLDRERRHDLFLDTAVIAAVSVPYVALRVVLLATTDAASGAYVTSRLEDLRQTTVPWYRYAEGIWMGMRAGWALVVAGVWLMIRQRPREAILISISIALTITAGLFVATDIGRSMSALFPAALLGLLLLVQARARWVHYGLPALLGLNLLLPASHILTIFKVPILSLPEEVAQYRHPPAYFDPKMWLGRAEHRWPTQNGGTHCAS